MADNVVANAGAGGATFRTDEVSVGIHVPYTKLMSGTDGATDLIPGDATNGLDVDVTRLPALPAGTNNIGDVDVLTLPALPAGTNNIGDVDILSIAAGDNNIGNVDIVTMPNVTLNALPAGTNNIGDVDVLSLPALPAGTNNIGDVDVLTLPALPAGTNNIGDVDVLTVPADPFGANADAASATGSISAKLRFIASTGIPITGTVTVGSHAVTNAGTFPVQVDGAALTALQLLDDTVKLEDAAHSSGDAGIMPLAVRRDANTSLVGTDGDYAPLQVNADGSLKVAITAGAGSGGTSATDDAAFTVASGSGTPIMGLADETTPDAVDEGDVGVVRMTLQRGLHVNLRDASGNEVAVGGGTQYDEDTAHVSGDKLTMAGVVRRDTAASGVGADGDRDTLSTDNTGRLWVNGSGVTQPISAASLPLPTGAATAANQTTGNTSLGTIAGAVAGTEMQVDVVAALPAGNNNIGDVDVASLVPGTGATNLGKAEDAAHTTGDVGVMALAVRNDTRGALAGTDGDYAPLQLNASGDLRVDGSAVTQPISAASLPLPTGAATAANQSTANTSLATIAGAVSGTEMQVDVLTLPNVTLAAGTNTNEVVGDAAHDAAIAGNPVRQGLRAMTADFAAVATGDTVDALATINGKQVVLPHALPGETWAYASAAGGLVNTTGVTAKAAAGAGIRNYVTSIQVINSHATISTEVVVRDGAAGTVLHRGWAQAEGGGYACKFDPPLRGTANTLVEIAEVTATATAGVLVNLQGYEAEE